MRYFVLTFQGQDGNQAISPKFFRCLIFEVRQRAEQLCLRKIKALRGLTEWTFKKGIVRGYSSAGRAPALQAGGHRFDPDYLHQGIATRTKEETSSKNMGLQLSRLERPPDKREVDGSSPFKPTNFPFNFVTRTCVYRNTTLRAVPR